MSLEERCRRASKGMLLLFIGQLVGLITLLPWVWAAAVGTVAVFVLSIWGLKVAGPAQGQYRVAFWLYVGTLVLSALLMGIAAAGSGGLEYAGMILVLAGVYGVLISVAVEAINILIAAGTAALFHRCGDERRAKNAGLCWKLMLAAPIASLLSLGGAAVFHGTGGLTPLSGLFFIPAMLGGIASLVASVLFMVVLWQGYDGLDDAADRLETLRLECEARAAEGRESPQEDEDAL